MRYMLLYKPGYETSAPPSEQEMAAVGGLIAEMAGAGVLLATDGLQPSAYGARVSITDGAFSVTDGPFTEAKELIASYALLQVDSREEAIEHTWSFLEKLGEGEVELWQVYEAPNAG